MQQKFTRTENGAIQFRTSGNRVLDFFAEIGSARRMLMHNKQAVYNLFANAIAENPQQAMAVMFWTRAIRLGAGERDVFYALLGFAYKNFPDFVKDNLDIVGKLGYYKDYVRIAMAIPNLEDDIAKIFAREIKQGNYFACKWIPRRTLIWSKVKKLLNMTNADFRRLIARSAETTEQKICAQKISEIDYSKVPSKAFNNYREIFFRKDRERFMQSLIESHINTGAIYPHEIFDILYQTTFISESDKKIIINAQWRNLKNFISPNMRFITVLDTSASMYYASRIAYPLAIYCSEHLDGFFKDKVISFSRDARYFDLSTCENVVEKYQKLNEYSIVENTNIASVFKLLLDTAIENNIPKEEMPNCLLILSDMQFDNGATYDGTLINNLKSDYKYAGYEFPAIIYWNLEATNTGIADNQNANATFVSGFNPKIMESILAGMEYDDVDDTKASQLQINPLKVMENAIEPILKMLNFERLTNIPKSFAQYNYDITRGYSFRMRSRTTKTNNIADALMQSEITSSQFAKLA